MSEITNRLNLGRSGKNVVLLHPQDYRKEDFPVIEEQDIGLQCTDNFRVRKLGPGWKGEKDTDWYCLEAVPITNCVKEDNQTPLPIREYLQWALTDKVYETLTDDFLDKLDQDFGVTVTFKPVEIPPDLDITPLKAWDYLQDHLRRVFSVFATSEEEPDWKDQLMEKGIIFALGAFFMYFVVKSGVISAISVVAPLLGV